MIIETIFSTVNASGQPNFAPMGIVWGEETVLVRPFRDTRTYQNLVATGCGVANLSDDVLSFVESALYNAPLPHFSASRVPCVVFQGACSWRELEIITERGTGERAELLCKVVYIGRQRDFLGFCRAQSAVIEAAILATRCHLYTPAEVDRALEQYEQIVGKTGGEAERVAIERVREFIGRLI
jgi:uncharacterized protein